MNNCSSKILKRSTTAFRSIHLRGLLNYCYLVRNRGITGSDQGLHCYSTTSPGVNYGRDDANNQHHRLLQLRALKAHSQHFCTQSSDQTINKLPAPIEQQCEQWAQILRAEWEASMEEHDWLGVKLACKNVLFDLKKSKLFLSTANLNPEQLRSLRHQFQIGGAVELKLFPHKQNQRRRHSSYSSIGPLDNIAIINNDLFGTVRKYFPDGLLINVFRDFNPQERQYLQRCSFDMRRVENPSKLERQLTFLEKRHSTWCKWPGYGTMLQAFKCQPLPEDTGVDPVDWVGSPGKDLDPSQCKALSAALNLKRPVVAVHGPPGSGKTHLLAEYLHALSQQGKKVLVVSSTGAGLYHLMATFCNKFPSAASSTGTFLSLKRFDAQLASNMISDEAIERLIEENSMSELQKDFDEKTRKNYELTKTLKLAMEKRPDLRENDLMREAEEVSEQMREISHRMSDEVTKNLLQDTSTVFTNMSNSMLNMFIRLGHTFDAVIIDDGARMSEFDCWFMALPTAPVLRLFGDYNQSERAVHSSMGRELSFNKSLMQRLDEQFGEEVNFHLQRQYRSNTAIQAWPNRAFYGQRAAEPDESVRNIRLDDLLEEGKSPPPELITDPLVLVDIGQLEGEWREWMFKAEEAENSWFNWGEALLAASHLWHLFEHIPQLEPTKIAYLTSENAQRNLLWRTFSGLFARRHLQKFGEIRAERSANLQGQQFDVVIKDSVTVPMPEEFTDFYHLKHLNSKMCRARRQFIWFADSKWLEEGSEQSRQLLRTFQNYGRIIGPNQLLPLGPGQFTEMTMKVEEDFQKMEE